MIQENATIKSSVTLSDNKEYRYNLSRIWDESKSKATVIMLNPSTADMLKTDRTVMNLTNFLVDKDFGSLTVVNLFAFRATDPDDLKNKKGDFEILNDRFLKKALESADVIIIAWTRGNYKVRKREVEQMLYGYEDRTKCFLDNKGSKPRHPRDLGRGWSLVDYEFGQL